MLLMLLVFSGSSFIVVKVNVVSISICIFICSGYGVVCGMCSSRQNVILVVSRFGSSRVIRLKVCLCGIFKVLSRVNGWCIGLNVGRVSVNFVVVSMNIVVVVVFSFCFQCFVVCIVILEVVGCFGFVYWMYCFWFVVDVVVGLCWVGGGIIYLVICFLLIFDYE